VASTENLTLSLCLTLVLLHLVNLTFLRLAEKILCCNPEIEE
jgi:hypothetical protein